MHMLVVLLYLARFVLFRIRLTNTFVVMLVFILHFVLFVP